MALLTLGAGGVFAQKNVILGKRIMSESELSSGQKYVLQYNVGDAFPFINDAGTYYDVPNSGNTPTEKSVYLLIADESKWKIQSNYTNKYII